MRQMPAYELDGYTVVVNALPTGEGRFYSVFSIHHGENFPALGGVPTMYQEGRGAGVVCETSDDAHDRAAERANEWIANHPLA